MDKKLQRLLYLILCLQLSVQIIIPILDTFFHLGDVPLISRVVLSNPLIQSSTEAIDNQFDTDGIADGKEQQEVISVCCPGAGFAGFWFTLGRLFAMEQRDLRVMELSTFKENSSESKELSQQTFFE